MKSYIHLIRHGLTQGLLEDWFYGWLDIPVVPEGCRILLDYKNQGIYPDATDADLYTSGMLRTNQTMNIIYDEPEYEEVPELKELRFGDWEGMRFSDMDSMTEWYEWSHDRFGTYTFPNGDSALSFNNRVMSGFEKVMKKHKAKEIEMAAKGKEANSIIVCHGGVISILMINFFPDVNNDDFFKWSPETGRGYTVIFEDGKPVDYKFI